MSWVKSAAVQKGAHLQKRQEHSFPDVFLSARSRFVSLGSSLCSLAPRPRWRQVLLLSAALGGSLNTPSRLLQISPALCSWGTEFTEFMALWGEKKGVFSAWCQSNDISGRADGINNDGRSGTGCHSQPKLWVNVLFKAHEVFLRIGHLGHPRGCSNR